MYVRAVTKAVEVHSAQIGESAHPTYRKIRRGKDSAGKARQKQRDLRYQRYKNKYDHHGSANYKNVREGVLNLDIQYARCGE